MIHLEAICCGMRNNFFFPWSILTLFSVIKLFIIILINKSKYTVIGQYWKLVRNLAIFSISDNPLYFYTKTYPLAVIFGKNRVGIVQNQMNYFKNDPILVNFVIRDGFGIICMYVPYSYNGSKRAVDILFET